MAREDSHPQHLSVERGTVSLSSPSPNSEKGAPLGSTIDRTNTLSSDPKERGEVNHLYDVAIVGAGPGGSAAAYYLARQGLDVLLLDKSPFPRDKTCGDALTPGALHVLDDMQLLDVVARVGYHINGTQIIAPNSYVLASTLPPKSGWPDYSMVLPRLTIDNMIREHAVAHGAKFEELVTVNDISVGVRDAEIRGVRDGHSVSFKARLVIVATGANVSLLMRMGLLKKIPKMMLAARTYYEDIPNLDPSIQMHFGGIPLPGYGWVFPVSETSANVGVGLCPVGLAAWWLHAKARPVFDQFVKTPPLQKTLSGAKQAGPIKGYPLRMDFATAPTFGDRVLLIGESAGLVNPLTGEGIDYALASGKLAAQHLIKMFETGNLSTQNLSGYDHILRERFQKLFIFCNWTRDLLVNRPMLNYLVETATHRPALKIMLMRIVLGHQINSDTV